MMQNLKALRDAASPGPWKMNEALGEDASGAPFTSWVLESATPRDDIGEMWAAADGNLAVRAPELATRYDAHDNALRALADTARALLSIKEPESEEFWRQWALLYAALDADVAQADAALASAAKFDASLVP